MRFVSLFMICFNCAFVFGMNTKKSKVRKPMSMMCSSFPLIIDMTLFVIEDGNKINRITTK